MQDVSGCCGHSDRFKRSQETEDNENNIGMRKIVDTAEETTTGNRQSF